MAKNLNRILASDQENIITTSINEIKKQTEKQKKKKIRKEEQTVRTHSLVRIFNEYVRNYFLKAVQRLLDKKKIFNL